MTGEITIINKIQYVFLLNNGKCPSMVSSQYITLADNTKSTVLTFYDENIDIIY